MQRRPGTVLPLGLLIIPHQMTGDEWRGAWLTRHTWTALIVGVGSGLSASFARTFAKAGIKVAVAARRAAELGPLAKEVGGKGFTCDATKRADVVKLFAYGVEEAFGAPDVVVFNAGYRTRGPFIELDPAEVEKTLIASAVRRLPGAAQEAAKRMLPHKHGAIILTGASASVKGLCAIGAVCDGQVRAARPGAEHGARIGPTGHPRRPRRDRRRHPQLNPRRPSGSARQHARSGCTSRKLIWTLLRQHRSAWAWEIRSTALARAILKLAATLRYNHSMEFLTKAWPWSRMALAVAASSAHAQGARQKRDQRHPPEPAAPAVSVDKRDSVIAAPGAFNGHPYYGLLSPNAAAFISS